MTKLPIGVQSFRSLIEGGFVYIDKTEEIHRLITSGVACFMSRPRRFGKSLLVSTLEAIFRGDKNLFENTWLGQSDYAWPKHPVIRLDFTNIVSSSTELMISTLNEYLVRAGAGVGVQLEPHARPAMTLQALLLALESQKPVILVDEYDRPLVRNLTDPELAEANRKELQDFFAVIKSHQEILRFVFITGVSRFSKVSLFSGMNSLKDLSLHADFQTIVGFTEQEIRETLGEPIERLAKRIKASPTECMEQLRQWYDGYRFSDEEDPSHLYNPWSVLNCLDRGRIDNYWFDTATPRFALELIKEKGFPVADFESGVKLTRPMDTNHELVDFDVVSLLFQTGYLTVESYDAKARCYRLVIPNEEVRLSLMEHLYAYYTGQQSWATTDTLDRLKGALVEQDVEAFFKTFNQLLAGIPYAIQVASESYYHSLIYLSVRLLGFSVDAEVLTNRGRIDLVVRTDTATFIFEFKIDSTAQKTLDQIKDKGYPERYRIEGKPLILVGANFSSKERTISDWQQQVSG